MSTGATLEGAVLLSGILQDVFNDDNGIEVIQAQIATLPRLEIMLHINSPKGRTALVNLMVRLGRVSSAARYADAEYRSFGDINDPLTSFSMELIVPRGDLQPKADYGTRSIRLTVWGAADR